MTPRLRKRLALDGLSPKVRRALDQMKRDVDRPTLDAMTNYLSDGPEEAPMQQGMSGAGTEETQDQNGKADRICALLEQAGVPPEAIQRVRDMLDMDNYGDGELLLQHQGGPVQSKKAFVKLRRMGRDEEYGAGPRSGYSAAGMQINQDQPMFPGAPEPGGGMMPLSGPLQTSSDENRRIAMNAAKNIKVLDARPASSYAKDRRQLAQDAKARERNSLEFYLRYPDAARIGFR
jgi:hypothetical protein